MSYVSTLILKCVKTNKMSVKMDFKMRSVADSAKKIFLPRSPTVSENAVNLVPPLALSCLLSLFELWVNQSLRSLLLFGWELCTLVSKCLIAKPLPLCLVSYLLSRPLSGSSNIVT